MAITMINAENQSYRLWRVGSGIVLHAGKDRSVPLAQEQAKELIEELQIYVNTGELRKPEPEFDYEQLSPNIRKLVKLLHSWGYETTDSGDGTNVKEGMECAIDYPMVAIRLPESTINLAFEANLLWEKLLDAGVPMRGEMHSRSVEATYSTADGFCLLLVLNVTDEDLPDV